MDFYFDPNYGKLYEKVEKGKSVCWHYEGSKGSVDHQFILREIPIADEQIWYDIVTPYGYGGPIITRLEEGGSRQELVAGFENAFSVYCKEQRIVSEFVRFHPVLGNAGDFGTVYNAQCIRHTLGTNLKDYEDPVTAEFSKGCRKNIRKALNNGVSWRVTRAPRQIDAFKEIYYSTMDRNGAGDYYYFDDAYFCNCLKWFSENLLFVEAVYGEKTIAAMLCFVYDKTIHIHLSGTFSEYLHLSPAYILRYAVAMWGKENGYELIHHGGGKSNSQEDSLFLYKKQFAKNTEFEFYVGKKIWNSQIYNELCQIRGVSSDTEYFPLYRA